MGESSDDAAIATFSVDHRGTLEPTAETLRSLHRAHMMAVPLENLDYQLGRRIILNDSHLFAKIVGERRGGVCYELNTLFSALLAEFVGQQGHRRDVAGAMATRAMLIENRRDIFGERRGRRRLRRGRRYEN